MSFAQERRKARRLATEQAKRDMDGLYAVQFGYGCLDFYETEERAIKVAQDFWSGLTKEEKASKEPIVEVYKFKSHEAVEKYLCEEYEDFFELVDTILTENDFRKEEEI